jgi:hypothetical protein
VLPPAIDVTISRASYWSITGPCKGASCRRSGVCAEALAPVHPAAGRVGADSLFPSSVIDRAAPVSDTAGHQQQVSVSALADGGVLAGPVVVGRAPVQMGCVPFPPSGHRAKGEGTMPSQPTPAHAASAADDAGYRPDPGREIRLTIDSFFKALAAAEPGDLELEARVRRRHRDLITARQARMAGEQSWMHLKMALVLVAAYQELHGRYRDEVLLARLREAFVEPLRPYVAQATSSSLEAAADPFSAMVAISKERERTFFGRASFSVILPTTAPGTSLRFAAASTTTCWPPPAQRS